MTDPEREPGAGTDPTDLTDPGSKTQPAEGGRDEVEDGSSGGVTRPSDDDDTVELSADEPPV